MKISSENKYYLAQFQRQIGLLFAGDAIFQTFLTEQGCTGAEVSSITVAATVTQLLSYFFSNFIADKIANVPKCLAGCFVGSASAFALLLLPCFVTEMHHTSVMVMCILSVVIYNIFMGFYGVLDYKTPYYLIPKGRYSSMAAKTSLIQGITGVTASFLFSFAVMRMSFAQVIPFGFMISAIMYCMASGVYISFQKLTPNEPIKSKRALSFSDHLKDKTLKWFILPHFVRGILNGVLVLGAVIFSGHISKEPKDMTMIASIMNFATFTGAFLCLMLFRRLSSMKVCIAGCILAGASVMFLLVSTNPLIFYIIFLLTCMGRCIIDLAVPVYVMETTPAPLLGFYTSLRLVMTFAGMAIGNCLAGYIAGLQIYNARIILAAVGAAAFAEAILFALYNTKKRQQEEGNEKRGTVL